MDLWLLLYSTLVTKQLPNDPDSAFGRVTIMMKILRVFINVCM